MTHNEWAKTLLPVLICSLVLLACSPPPPAQPPPTPTPGPLDLIKALESAMNRGDTDAALDLFLDEGLGYGVWGMYAQDKESLRYILDWWAGMANPDNTFRDCQSEAARVTCTWDFYLDAVCSEGMGFDVVHYQIAFTFQDNKIRGMLGDIVSDEKAAVDAAIADMFTWAAESLPEKYQNLERFWAHEGGSGREQAELELEICREYAEAMSK